MIDPLATWQSTFAALPQVADTSWAQNFADWVEARVSSKMKLQGVGGPNLAFTFNKSVFASQLIALTPTADALSGITGFAEAWETAINASDVETGAGSYIGSPSSSTTWSVVNSTTIDAASIALAKAKIIELKDAPTTDNAADSEFPIKFRAAFLLLTITTNGLDSDGDGPYPLNDPARAVE